MPIVRHGYENHRAERRAQYDSPLHRQTRRAWAGLVATGCANCARCGKPINPGSPWDLDHTPDRTAYLGPSHASCNRGNRGYGGVGAGRKHMHGQPPPHLGARKTA